VVPHPRVSCVSPGALPRPPWEELESVKDRWVTGECAYDRGLVGVAVPELLQNITHSSVSRENVLDVSASHSS